MGLAFARGLSVLLVGAGACAAPTKSTLPPRYGTTTFLFQESEDETKLRIERLALVVDGATVFDWPVPDPDSMELSRLALAPGEHEVSFSLSATRPSAPTGTGRCELVVGETRKVVVTSAPAELHFSAIRTRSWPFVGGRVVALRARAEELGPGEEPLGVVDAECRVGAPIARAICDTETRLRSARAERDVVQALCENDKLTQLRALRTAFDRASSSATPDDRERAVAIEQRALALGREAQQCPGSGPDGTPYGLLRRGVHTDCPK